MESVIREGALRLLTNECSCDVILSCQGHRVMAHRVILSMASPVFRNLLKESASDPTVIILPDISSNTMSLILDYIYTGSVIIYSNTIQDFLSLASLLQIHLDIDFSKMLPGKNHLFEKNERKFVEKKEEVVSSSDMDIYSKKNQRKLPKLVPLDRCRVQEKPLNRKKLYSYVLPSPWCPRVEGLFGDPRDIDFSCGENQIIPTSHHHKTQENDPNNNLQPETYSTHHSPNKAPDNSESHLFEKDRSLNEYSRKSYRLENINNGLLNSTISRSRNAFHWTSDISHEPLSLEVRRTQKKPEKKDKDDSVQERIRKNTPPLESVPSVDCEEPKREIRLSLNENESEHSCSDEADENTSSGLVEKQRKEKPFKCGECGKSFSQLRNYKYHRSVHEGTKEFAAKCSECGKTFNDKGYLSSHMKIHKDKKEYACPHCPKRFNQRVAYNMHLRIHTGVKPHECSTCGKSFSRKMLLKQHQRVHTGERPYTCPECGKTFADRSNMSLHARLHTGVKPYVCTLCPKSFTKKHHLKTHMNFHTGLKPYTCQNCGLAFSQSSNMRTHFKKCLLKDDHLQNIARNEEGEGSNAQESSCS